jgi:hypothetical protein
MTTANLDWWMHMMPSTENRFKLASQAVADNALKDI